MAVATLLGSHGGLYTGVFAPDGEHVLRLGLKWFSFVSCFGGSGELRSLDLKGKEWAMGIN